MGVERRACLAIICMVIDIGARMEWWPGVRAEVVWVMDAVKGSPWRCPANAVCWSVGATKPVHIKQKCLS
jgi:hypothetical protein